MFITLPNVPRATYFFFHPLRLILTGVLAREGQINSYCESQNLNIYNTTHLPFFIV